MQVDKQLLRENVNFLCVYQQRLKYTKDISNEYEGSEFIFEGIKAIINSCWCENYGFLTTDTRKKVKQRPIQKTV